MRKLWAFEIKVGLQILNGTEVSKYDLKASNSQESWLKLALKHPFWGHETIPLVKHLTSIKTQNPSMWPVHVLRDTSQGHASLLKLDHNLVS